MPPSTPPARALAGALAATLAALTLSTATTPAHADVTGVATTSTATVLTAEQASAKARATKTAVPVDAATTATDQLTANADGSFTLNRALAPVRKRQGGAWKPLDATLVKRADGTIGTAATTSDLTLSGGGGGPLAVMKSGKHSLALALPASLTANLPAPTLSGPTATYPLLTGVDLKVTADTQGSFSEVLVVKDATAAANPALKSLSFTTQTTGVDLATDSGGNITAKDDLGKVVFSAPAPVKGVWDSAVDATAPTVVDPTTGTTLDARSGDPAHSTEAGPGATSHTAPLKAAYSSGAITLTPDPGLLSGQHTVWPLYIDPTYSAAGGGYAQAWTYVSSAFPTTSYWKTSDTEGLRVGDNAWEPPYYVGRAFAQMSVPSTLYGATISESTFYATETWSASCTASNVELWLTGGISQATTWNNQPTWISKSADRTVAYGHDSNCPAQSVGFDTKTLMQSAANGSWTNVTLGLKAFSESDSNGWKKFQPSTMYMSTTYDHAPDAPGPLSTSPATACSANPPNVIGNGDVTLSAGVSDPDGGSLGVAFTLVNPATGATIASSTTSSLSATSGTTTSLVIPRATLANDANGKQTTYRWNVFTSDGTLTSPTSPSNSTNTCSFTFDPTYPGAPTITQGTTSHTVGTAASFTLAPNPTSPTQPASYLYQLNGTAPSTVSATSGTATISITPTRGVNTLTVTAVSPGGNIGDSASLTFNATAPATALENDLTGAGHADLVVVGNQTSLPPGLWLASGATTRTLNGAAVNIGTQGTGANSAGTAADWNGSQAIVGHFRTGGGFNDILQYDPLHGTGHILYGTGDGSPLSPNSLAQRNIDSTAFQMAVPPGSTTMVNATHVASGGSLSNTANGNPATGYPDLLLTLNGHLWLEPAFTTAGKFDGGNRSDLGGVNPTGSGDWNGWTITTTLVNGLPALFARADSDGQLYYYSPTVLTNLTTNLLNAGSGLPPATPTAPVMVAASGWDSKSKPVIQAADINRDNTADLWSVDANGNATAYIFDGTTLTTQSPQAVTSPTHSWTLTDSTDAPITNAAKDQVGTNLSLSGGPLLPDGKYSATMWHTGDLFSPDVFLNNPVVPSGETLPSPSALTATKPATAPATGTTTGSAVDLSSNFTASVWAKPSNSGGVILSQVGTNSSGLLLYPDTGTNQWFFCLGITDDSTWSYDCAHGATFNLGAWTHLTVAYNAATQQMALYVNGIEAGTATHKAVAAGTFASAFTVGDYLYQGKPIAYYSGQVAQIQTWNQALTPGQIGGTTGPNGAVTLPSDGTTYPSGSSWQLAGNTVAFNQGQLTVTIAGTQRYSLGSATNSNAVMVLQADGDLRAYKSAADAAAANTTNVLWTTSTPSHGGDSLIFQPDGNLVLYGADGVVLWSTQTNTSTFNRVVEAVEGGVLHEIYTDATGWHDNAVSTVGGNISALAFTYSPTGQRVIEAVEGGVLHEIYTDANGKWIDGVVPGAGGNITALSIAYGPTGRRIEASEGGVLHEIYIDTTSNNWVDQAVSSVGTGITALSFTYSPAGLQVIEAAEGGVLHEIYTDGNGKWTDNPNLSAGANITPLSFAYNMAGQRVIEAVESGVLHEIYSDGSKWIDGTVSNAGAGITALSAKTTLTNERIIETVENGALHEIYSNQGTWSDNPIGGTAGNATAVSFNLH